MIARACDDKADQTEWHNQRGTHQQKRQRPSDIAREKRKAVVERQERRAQGIPGLTREKPKLFARMCSDPLERFVEEEPGHFTRCDRMADSLPHEIRRADPLSDDARAEVHGRRVGAISLWAVAGEEIPAAVRRDRHELVGHTPVSICRRRDGQQTPEHEAKDDRKRAYQRWSLFHSRSPNREYGPDD